MVPKKKKNTKDTNHVNKTKTEVYRYLLKKKDGMPTGASPSIDAWVSFEIFTWGALGIPKLELFPLLLLLTSRLPRSSNTSSTQNFNKNFVRSVSVIKQTTTLRYCNELILYSYWCNIYCIPTSLWFIPSDTTHRCIKISKQHIENRICQKQNSL